MKTKQQFTLVFFLLLSAFSYAQGGLLGNTRPALGNPLGWTGGVPGTLDIRNDFTQPIDFWTNSIRRMRITDGGTGVHFGRIAMGNNLPNNFAPLSRLHLHQDAGVNTIRFTTGNMGGINGFQVGYDASGNAPNRRYAQLLNHENTAMKFFTSLSLHLNTYL